MILNSVSGISGEDQMANLDWLIKNGKGDKPVTEARFRCKDCGEIVEKLVRPPVPTVGGAVAYI